MDLPPVPPTVRCTCGAPIYFARSGVIGKRGHFECKKCGKKYGFSEEEWTPFKKPSL